MYLDRSHIKHAKLLCINDLGQLLFKEIILLDSRVSAPLLNAFSGEVELERHGGKIDFSLLKQITEMYSSYSDQDSNTYFTILEKEFIINSRIFYRNETNILFKEENRVSEYLNKVNFRKIKSIR